MSEFKKPILRVLDGERVDPPPIWLMRQAGRYLPEYRELRTRASTFLDFCYTPKLAAEATLQPLRRFDFDAAIVFSDILVVPDALGQKVSFESGEGPKLEPLNERLRSKPLKLDMSRLDPVCETLSLVKTQLAGAKALLGFCGAPWTVASYMIAGGSSSDQIPARRFAYEQADRFRELIDLLVEASIDYLCAQIDAGADAFQIFDSWAGVLPTEELEKWSIEPITRILKRVNERRPHARSIVFARGVGSRLGRFAALAANGLGLDTTQDLETLASATLGRTALQGNLDPLALVAGGAPLERATLSTLRSFSNRPHILNLGHGIRPETPISHVEQMIAIARGYTI